MSAKYTACRLRYRCVACIRQIAAPHARHSQNVTQKSSQTRLIVTRVNEVVKWPCDVSIDLRAERSSNVGETAAWLAAQPPPTGRHSLLPFAGLRAGRSSPLPLAVAATCTAVGRSRCRLRRTGLAPPAIRMPLCFLALVTVVIEIDTFHVGIAAV
jgi:hypothetical protein